MHLENVAMPPEKVEVNLKVLRLTKRKANQAAKSVAIPTPAARKTIGDSSFKATTRSSVIKSPISAKKAVQDENNDEYEDSNEFDEDMEEDYEEPDLYEEENTEEIIEEEEPATHVTLEEALQRQQAKELRKALSLNDRFRFRRELFGNSDIRMNETLSLIDAMQSYEEAEDYILNDLIWDVENPDVAEFMKIVQKHFL